MKKFPETIHQKSCFFCRWITLQVRSLAPTKEKKNKEHQTEDGKLTKPHRSIRIDHKNGRIFFNFVLRKIAETFLFLGYDVNLGFHFSHAAVSNFFSLLKCVAKTHLDGFLFRNEQFVLRRSISEKKNYDNDINDMRYSYFLVHELYFD